MISCKNNYDGNKNTVTYVNYLREQNLGEIEQIFILFLTKLY